MAPTTNQYGCFNKLGHPRGHFFSCNDLYSRGVWVGYLTPQKFGERYRGLASYSEIKKNCKKFSQPYPESVPGKPGDERSAVCRGCVGSNSQLLTLQELSFVGNTKLVIMPLDGADNLGMFCILLPQRNDRSLKGLQIYRPYEHREGRGAGDFTTNIMILTLRNTSQTSGTLESVRSILSSLDPPNGDAHQPSSSVEPEQTQLANQHDAPLPRKRTLSTRSYEIRDSPVARKRQQTESPAPSSRQPNLPSRETTGTLDDLERATQTSPKLEPGLRAGDLQSFPITVGDPPCLTKAQSKRICFVWVIEADGVEYCFSHSLASCNQLSDYFDLVREDAADAQEVLTIMDEATVWRLTYQLPGLPKKAFTVRNGDENGYEKLLQSLAQCALSHLAPNSKLDVEFRVLK